VIEAAIYFCAREAIQNAAKHAGAGATVTVTLARRRDAVEFTVSDDGVGISPEMDPEGTGITGMRDRIEAAGGTLEIVSPAGGGTRVHGTVPLPRDHLRDGAARRTHPERVMWAEHSPRSSLTSSPVPSVVMSGAVGDKPSLPRP